MKNQNSHTEVKSNWVKPELVTLDNEHIRTGVMGPLETPGAMGGLLPPS